MTLQPSQDRELRDMPMPRAGELRDVRVTDQAIRRDARPNRAATEVPTALTAMAGKPATELRGGRDGR
jgi:hypothetical protein